MMKFEKNNIPAITSGTAMIEVHAIEQEAQVMGANDYESEAFSRIREQLENRVITPSEAISQA